MTDVVIVGAGLAGLVTARQLTMHGLDVRVVEARDRVGGRTLSRRVGDAVFDFGGQWILPTQQHMLALVDELNIELTPQFRDGHTVFVRRGVRWLDAGLLAKLPPLYAIEVAYRVWQLRRLHKRGAPIADQSFAEWIDNNVRVSKAKQALQMFTQMTFAVEPDELSLHWFLEATAAGGGVIQHDQFDDGAVAVSCVGGAQQLCERLAGELVHPVVLTSPVSAVEQVANSVAVRAGGCLYEARRAVLTLPPPALAELEIAPALTEPQHAMLLGPIIKCLATYDTAFWRDEGLSGEAYANDATVRAIVDASSSDGCQPALLGFIVGEAARQWSQRSPAQRQQAVLDDLVQCFGDAAREPSHFAEIDWLAQEYSHGCVGVFGVGSQAADWAQARKPNGNLFFASADTAASWPGHMEGAVVAGERAAAEVLNSFD